MAIVYKPRNIYSEDAYGDSFSPSYLHQVSSSYLTYGSFSSYDNLDYYYINATAGNYKLTVTTEGLSNVYNNNFTVSIIDSFGNTILTEDAFRSDVYTDNITFYYGGSGAFYVKIVNNYYQAFSYALTLASTYVAPADITSPIVYSIAYGSNDGSLALGEAVTLAVTLNEAVYVTGTPTLALANGGTATYTGGSGTSTLTFSYTAAAGQATADLATAASNALAGTIKDLAGNAVTAAGFNGVNPTGTLAVDVTAPSASTFTPTDGATAVAVGANIVLTFSENIAKGTGAITIRSGSATGTIVESFDAATSSRISISGSTLTIDPTNNLAGNTRYFVVFSSGNVRDLAGNAYRGTSTYDFTTGSAPTTTSDDYTNTAATTGRVFTGSAATTGTIEVAGDVDAFRVYLTAGATYTFNLDATSGSLDPYLSLYDPNLTQIAYNNDYGSSRNAQITFTATSSGAYYLAAEGLTGTGAYSLRATTTAADDYSFNTATTGVVTIGGAATTGRINYADDADLFRVALTAGVTYTFNLNATSGPYNPYLSLLDSNGTLLAYNDDFGSSLNSQITFTASSSGTYYLAAFSFGTDTGTYSLQGRIGSTSAIAQSALSVAPADSLGRSDGMAPETDLAIISPSKSNEPSNQIGVIEAEILLALANSNDPFANEHLALQNFSVNQGAHPQSILLEHSPHTTHYSVADTFHFGSEDVLEHFRNDDVALTRTEFNAVIFDPAHHWTANSAFDPAIYNGDEVIFDVTEFGSLSTANGYHQVDFIL